MSDIACLLTERSGATASQPANEVMREQAFVAGRWCDADSRETLAVIDPASLESIGTVPNMGAAETQRAIAAAADAQPLWARRTAFERGAILRRWAVLMAERRESLALLMTREQGKPLAEARGEIDYAASFLTWFAEEGERHDGSVLTSHLPNCRMFTLQAPVGVTAAITPWNFPSAMITRKAGAALAAGCAMIVRPASETPFSALALAALAEESGVPAGIFSVVTGDPEPIAGELLETPTIRQISFTGSTRVGRLLAAGSAATVKRVAMELGGHAPFIVLADADLDRTIEGAIGAKFATSGQDCLAANRLFVARELYAEFCKRYAAAVAGLRVGSGLEDGVDIGPLIGPRAVALCQAQVDDALAQGATCLVGGAAHPRGPNFYQPTVLADVTPAMRIFREETFGPVAAILPFDREADVVRMANDSEYGLAAYLCGSDISALWRIAEALEYGMISVNGTKMTGPPVPFGGMKQSGLGREGSRRGIEEYSETKYLCIHGLGA